MGFLFFLSVKEFGKGRSSVSRCDLPENLLEGGCGETSVEFPTSRLKIEEDAALSDKASGTADDVTQIRPQKLHMLLRPGTFTHVRQTTIQRYHTIPDICSGALMTQDHHSC